MLSPCLAHSKHIVLKSKKLYYIEGGTGQGREEHEEEEEEEGERRGEPDALK